jgi:hypothetical protein
LFSNSFLTRGYRFSFEFVSFQCKIIILDIFFRYSCVHFEPFIKFHNIFSHSTLIIFGLTFIHLSDGLSGIVTIHLISNLLLLFNFCRNGIPIGAEEKNTMLYLCGSYILCFHHVQENTLSTTFGSADKNQYLLNDNTQY